MSFQLDLLGAMREGAGPSVLERGLSAAKAAKAVSPLLSVRTLDDWMQGRRTPPDWTHDMILTRIKRAAKAARAREPGAMRPPNAQVEPRDCLAPKAAPQPTCQVGSLAPAPGSAPSSIL